MFPSPPRPLSQSEEAALARVARCRPLLALDFDGTLAPIVTRPQDAQVPETTATVLASLAERCRVAIVTGRRIDDVRPRLGFIPWRIVGNHGAECGTNPILANTLARSLDGLRAKLPSGTDTLSAAGVVTEDKHQSIAFHYRNATDHARALSAIQAFLAGATGNVHVFGGKHVINVTAAGAPDKAQAVESLFVESGAGTVLYAGDDVNDEPVFRAAAADWLTVQVGPVAATKAAIVVESPRMLAALLHRLLELLVRQEAARV